MYFAYSHNLGKRPAAREHTVWMLFSRQAQKFFAYAWARAAPSSAFSVEPNVPISARNTQVQATFGSTDNGEDRAWFVRSAPMHKQTIFEFDEKKSSHSVCSRAGLFSEVE